MKEDKKKALIIGITGMDGSHLSELLLDKGYEVHGVIRRHSHIGGTGRIDHIFDELKLHYGDVTDALNISRLISEIQPDEIYNLSAQSHVKVSFEEPGYTAQVDAIGTLNVMESARIHCPNAKIYQASTSEMFGGLAYNRPENGYTEESPFHPRSPYGVAKVYGFWIVKNYREAYNMHASNGILFNHEGERRGVTFVTRKVTRALAAIKKGEQDVLTLGNMDSLRDWGYAKEYCINLDVPILTTSGWKFYDEISEGDQIINFNSEENHITTDTVKSKIVIKSNGEKIKLTGRGVCINVTPDHRIYYQKKSKKSKGGWSKYKICTAKEFYDLLKNKAYRTKYDYRLPHFQDYDKKENEKYSDNELYLIGALLAEGCLSNSNPGRGSIVSLSQSFIKNEKIHKKLQKIIDDEKLEARLCNKNNGVTEWVFTADSSKKIIEYFDGFDVHVMPKDFYNLSSRQCKIVFDSLMDCDGCWGSYTYTSKRNLLASDFQTIAHLAGYRTTGVKFVNNVYITSVITRSKKHMYIQNVESYNDNNDKVWCVNSNNGTIITRDQNCINIVGNCEGMWRMLQQDTPDDYVLATNETHTVRQFVEEAVRYCGWDIEWRGEGVDEKGYDKSTGKLLIEINPKYYRPSEVDLLLGDATKAKEKMGWEPKTKFKDLVKLMMEHDLKA